MRHQLFLATFDHPNFQWTVLGSDSEKGPEWEKNKLREFVPELEDMPANPRIWGVKPGSNNSSYYKKMGKRDYILFYENKKYRWVGNIGHKFQSSRFSQEYWVEGTECSMLYTVDELEKIDLSRQKFNNILEYEKRGNTEWNPQGVQRVKPSKAGNIIEEYGSLEEFIRELVEDAKQDPWWK